MTKIALISDIHSNLTALEAVAKDIKKRRIQRVICLGDLVGKGPQPGETVDKIRELCEATLLGNWDDAINRPQDKESALWQQERLGAERLEYLRKLPFSLDLQLSGYSIRLFHASSRSVYHRVTRKASKRDKLEMFENTDRTRESAERDDVHPAGASGNRPEELSTPIVVGYGDIHVPFVQTIKNKQKRGLILFNTGSVGAPYDGIPQASYAILEGTPNSAVQESLGIQIVRVPYAINEAIAKAEELGMPDLERYRYELSTGLKQ